MKSSFETVEWRDGALVLIDQRKLPVEETYVRCETVGAAIRAINDMVVRGAPAIGVTAAFGVALAALERPEDRDAVARACDALLASRPTAVNLGWAVERMRRRALGGANAAQLLAEAQAIREEDIAACRRLGSLGADLVPDMATVLTHCNAGALATAGWGTALGVIRSAVEAGKSVKVIADETRPLLQGARLTAWELDRDGIDVTVISDVAAASIIAGGEVDLVLVGADRIAANGDFANKIGTYGVALAAHAEGIPFYVAAPWSTVDMSCPDGDAIPIEERPASEVEGIGDRRLVPTGVRVRNPAFDVTPYELVSAIVTERAVVRPPFLEGLARLQADR